MPVITIDGKKIEAAPGKTIIEAALDNGISIPHFCWHPSLSVAGNCRMCLVAVGNQKKNADGSLVFDETGNPDVAYMGKLAIACATPVADGMFVDTVGEKTKAASDAVMEFILINHPLDCPICDEAGQCKLQEYAFKHSKGESRFEETKNHKDKRVAWGPNVMFDGERCISCSRCIRYSQEIAKQPVLSFVQRGDHVTIETFPDTQFDSPYSMNVIELCPVGALTSIDFRFKSRVWDMSFTNSVCAGCSRGCNTSIGVRDNEIQRIEPRANPKVNEFWMCDAGRLQTYKWVNANRVEGAIIRENGSATSVDWTKAYSHVASKLSSYKHDEIAIVLSGGATNEDAYAAIKLGKNILKADTLVYVQRHDENFGDDFLRTTDRNPNSAGLDSLGIKGISSDELCSKISHGKVKALWVIGDEIIRGNEEMLQAVSQLEFFVVQVHNHCQSTEIAHVVLGSATYAESEGTFTNVTNRVQYLKPAVATQDNLRNMGLAMSRLDRFGSHNDRWTQGEKRNCKQHWKLIQGIAAAMGNQWSFTCSEDVFEDLSAHNAQYASMNYEALTTYMGITLGKGSSPEPVGLVYESHEFKPN